MLTVLVLLYLYAWPSHVPQHVGRPVSAWFHDLCGLYFAGMPREQEGLRALKEFRNMDSNAVPYLIVQMQYDRNGIRQRLYDRFLRFSFTQKLTFHWVLSPNMHRAYAVVALREMGPNAQAAVPALMELWAHDASAKGEALMALESILEGTYGGYGSQVELTEREARVFAEAARRHPTLALQLGIAGSQKQ